MLQHFSLSKTGSKRSNPDHSYLMLHAPTSRVHVNQQKVIDLSQNQLDWEAGGTSPTNKKGWGGTLPGLVTGAILTWRVSIFRAHRAHTIAIPFLQGITKNIKCAQDNPIASQVVSHDEANSAVVFFLRGRVAATDLLYALPCFFKFLPAVLPTPGLPQRGVLWARACFTVLGLRYFTHRGLLCPWPWGRSDGTPHTPPPQSHLASTTSGNDAEAGETSVKRSRPSQPLDCFLRAGLCL